MGNDSAQMAHVGDSEIIQPVVLKMSQDNFENKPVNAMSNVIKVSKETNSKQQHDRTSSFATDP